MCVNKVHINLNSENSPNVYTENWIEWNVIQGFFSWESEMTINIKNTAVIRKTMYIFHLFG